LLYLLAIVSSKQITGYRINTIQQKTPCQAHIISFQQTIITIGGVFFIPDQHQVCRKCNHLLANSKGATLFDIDASCSPVRQACDRHCTSNLMNSPGNLTCKPAGTAGYWPALAAAVAVKCPNGCSTQSEAMCEKTVLLTRQQQRSAALAAAIAATVASFTTTCATGAT
jgi:hypothetical protein